ncbi:CNH domain-containing protein [Phascolomyces articulosus]|uniref:CNH domain-containing protein n=1 Tax=Phascolomyces articulosus TaxID=60185 RepID=A0AAD5K0R8_9FUNG|nr:CNH domain-containing protein [Phascolomyces articulosus]
MLQPSNHVSSVRKQRSAAQLRPSTPRTRRISGPLVVGGMFTTQNSPSPPPVPTTVDPASSSATIDPYSSSFNTNPSPPFVPQPTQDYISAYRSSQQMMGTYARSINNTPLYDEHEDYLIPIDSADCSILSVVSEAFVRQLGNQEIFTGEEATNALHRLLASAYYPEYRSIEVANALMHCKPHVLFQPLEDYGNPPRSNVSFIPAWNQKYILRFDSLEEETKPIGVLSSLSRCYVAGCEPGNTDCYAPRCPNNPGNAMREILHADQSVSVPAAVRSLLHDNTQIDVDSSITLSGTDEQTILKGYYCRQDSNSSNERNRHDSYEEEIAESKREKKRQKAILQLIQSHRSYCKKLDILHHIIIDSILSTDSIGKQERRESLVANAFSTYDTLRILNKDLQTEMIYKQKESQEGKIDSIGDIFYYNIKLMSEPLITYVTNIPLANYIIEHECATNPDFAQLMERAKQNELVIDTVPALHYLYLAPRMQIPQYMTCLRDILAHTPEHHPDFIMLKRCNEKVERIERESKRQAKGDTEKRVQALQLADDLIVGRQDVDLELSAPQRRLFHHGALKKSSSLSIRKKTIHIFVLDHMVLLTTTTKQRDIKHTFLDYIPLPMLHVQESKTNWIAKPPSSSSSSSSGGGESRRRKISLLNNSSTQEDLSPTITLVHLGRRHQKPRVFSCSMEEKKRCLTAIDQARKQYKINNKNKKPFGLDLLNHSAFRVYYEISSRNGDIAGYDRVNCSVPLGTEDDMILVGTNTGVYSVHKNSITGETLLPIGKVTQMAFMREAGLLLVLTAENQELKAYTIETIIDANDRNSGYSRAPQAIIVDYYVQFFQVGSTRHHKDLLIYMKKRHHENVLVAVKPSDDLYNGTAARDRAVLSSPQYFSNRPITSSPPQGYVFRRVHHDNIRGTGVRTVQFCGNENVALVCQNNFRFFSFGDGEPHERRSSLPLDDRRRKDDNSIEARAAFYIKPNRILLCYNRYGYLIDEHHNIIPSDNSNGYLFKFESDPDNVVRHKDYIIGFSDHFIEIRSLNSGELVQIIHADSCQLTYEGWLGGEHVIHGCKVEYHGSLLDRQQLFQLGLQHT